MGKEQRLVSEIYDGYIDVLLDGYVYYLPKDVLSPTLLHHFEGVVGDDYYDCAHVIVKGEFGNGSLQKLQTLQFEKVSRLETIYFELLRLEEELSPKEFHMLIHKYMDYVEFLASMAKWFTEHLETYFEVEGDTEAYGIFGNQWNHFSIHFLELFSAFGKGNNYEITDFYSIEEFVGKYLPDFVGRYKKFSQKFPFDNQEDDVIETTPNTKTKSRKQKKKKEKPVLIADEEADLFLLETVFNVKFD